MKITKRSPFTGIEHTMEIPVKEADYEAWQRGEGLIQNLMPYLSADEREFLMTGITADEWNDTFGHPT